MVRITITLFIQIVLGIIYIRHLASLNVHLNTDIIFFLRFGEPFVSKQNYCRLTLHSLMPIK